VRCGASSSSIQPDERAPRQTAPVSGSIWLVHLAQQHNAETRQVWPKDCGAEDFKKEIFKEISTASNGKQFSYCSSKGWIASATNFNEMR
jgi:hypothetical protein